MLDLTVSKSIEERNSLLDYKSKLSQKSEEFSCLSFSFVDKITQLESLISNNRDNIITAELIQSDIDNDFIMTSQNITIGSLITSVQSYKDKKSILLNDIDKAYQRDENDKKELLLFSEKRSEMIRVSQLQIVEKSEQLNQLTKEENQLIFGIVELKEQVEAKKTRIDNLKQNSLDLQSQISNAEMENQKYEVEYSEKENLVNLRTTMIITIGDEVRLCRMKIGNLKNTIAEEKNRNAGLQKSILKLRTDLEYLQKEKDDAINNDRFRSMARDLQIDVDRLRTKVKETKEKMNRISGQLNTTCRDNESDEASEVIELLDQIEINQEMHKSLMNSLEIEEQGLKEENVKKLEVDEVVCHLLLQGMVLTVEERSKKFEVEEAEIGLNMFCLNRSIL